MRKLGRILLGIITIIVLPFALTIVIVDAMYWDEAQMLVTWFVLTILAFVLFIKLT